MKVPPIRISDASCGREMVYIDRIFYLRALKISDDIALVTYRPAVLEDRPINK